MTLAIRICNILRYIHIYHFVPSRIQTWDLLSNHTWIWIDSLAHSATGAGILLYYSSLFDAKYKCYPFLCKYLNQIFILSNFYNWFVFSSSKCLVFCFYKDIFCHTLLITLKSITTGKKYSFRLIILHSHGIECLKTPYKVQSAPWLPLWTVSENLQDKRGWICLSQDSSWERWDLWYHQATMNLFLQKSFLKLQIFLSE